MNKYAYFTFPLKFLWEKRIDKGPLLNMIIDWSIYNFMITKLHENTDEEKYVTVQNLLNFEGGSLVQTKANFSTLNSSVTTNEIYTSVKTTVLFDVRNEIVPFNHLLLLAAVKSVIGKRNYNLTYKNVLIKRMYGNRRSITRYSFNKLMDAVINRGFFQKIPAGRGYYVSTKYRDIEEFEKAIVRNIKKYKTKKVKSNEAGRRILIEKRNEKNVRTIPLPLEQLN